MHRFSAIATLAAAAASAAGHEFWIMPGTFTPAAGEAFRLRLMHGERFEGDAVTRDDRRIERFELIIGDDELPTRGPSGGTTSFARADAEGQAVLVYESAWMTSTLDADSFEAYLREEGLDAIARHRADHGLTDLPGRERYRRCAKALLHAVSTEPGRDGSSGAAAEPDAATPLDRAVGLPCELILESAASSVTARVLLDGAPLTGARVVFAAEDDPASLHIAHTDQAGRVRLADAPPDTWMITTLHMQQAADDAGTEWESYWASLVFSTESAQQDQTRVTDAGESDASSRAPRPAP